MKIILFGNNGQVGWELQRSLAPLGKIFAYNRLEANFANINAIRNIIQDIKPNIIVNAVAYTAVDKAEKDIELAKCINTDAVACIAQEAKKLNALFVHYSTDYVFDGAKLNAYIETDKVNPQNIYGSTKCDGEYAIQNIHCNHLIFRTSWVYANRGTNFVKTILKLAQEKTELRIISDQIGTPTSAKFIADTTALCLLNFNPSLNGIYHLTASGETSWYNYAKFIVTQSIAQGLEFSVKPENIYPILSQDYPQIALRPKNSRLNTNKLLETFGAASPPWQTQCKQIINEIITGSILCKNNT